MELLGRLKFGTNVWRGDWWCNAILLWNPRLSSAWVRWALPCSQMTEACCGDGGDTLWDNSVWGGGKGTAELPTLQVDLRSPFYECLTDRLATCSSSKCQEAVTLARRASRWLNRWRRCGILLTSPKLRRVSKYLSSKIEKYKVVAPSRPLY